MKRTHYLVEDYTLTRTACGTPATPRWITDKTYHVSCQRCKSYLRDHNIPDTERKLVTRRNLMSGLEYQEYEDTPGFMSPASEAYWSM